MLAAILLLTVLVVLLTLSVGLTFGWLIRSYLEDHPPSTWTPHPELFNADGTLIPSGELLAVRVDGEVNYNDLMAEEDEES